MTPEDVMNMDGGDKAIATLAVLIMQLNIECRRLSGSMKAMGDYIEKMPVDAPEYKIYLGGYEVMCSIVVRRADELDAYIKQIKLMKVPLPKMNIEGFRAKANEAEQEGYEATYTKLNEDGIKDVMGKILPEGWDGKFDETPIS